MSLWTDIRDTVTAPFRAVGDLVEDIAHGNFFKGVENFASRETTWFLDASTGGTTHLLNTDIGKDIANNKIVNALTLGTASDFQKFGAGASKINSGADFSWSDTRDTLESFGSGSAKVGAAILTAGTASATAAGAGASQIGVTTAGITGAYGAGATVGKIESSLSSGNYLDALTGAANVASSTGLSSGLDLPSLPDGVSQALTDAQKAAQDAQNAYDLAQGALGDAQNSADRAAGLVDLAKSNTPAIVRGYSSNGTPITAGATSTTSQLVMLGGAALLAFYLLRRK